MRLIIIRHGETEWNRLRRTQGTTDTALSVRGRRQAKRLGARLSGAGLRCVYSSPLCRAKETAAAIALASPAARLELAPALVEIRFGAWEGLTFEEIATRYPQELELWNRAPAQCVPPGDSETLPQVAARLRGFLSGLCERHRGETVAAVSHSIPCKLMVALGIGLPLDGIHSLRMDNASMTVLDFYEERAVLRHFNDTAHLLNLPACHR